MIPKMPINDDLIRKRISEIREGIALLKRYLEKEFGELDISETLSIRYLIIQLVEAAASICMHILSSMYQEYPEEYPMCFLAMAKRGPIPRDLGEISESGEIEEFISS
ncbi:MAG: HepT-like ribonuclease domain-containing protein [Candidatus Njordarchaeales archaeon]